MEQKTKVHAKFRLLLKVPLMKRIAAEKKRISRLKDMNFFH